MNRFLEYIKKVMAFLGLTTVSGVIAFWAFLQLNIPILISNIGLIYCFILFEIITMIPLLLVGFYYVYKPTLVSNRRKSKVRNLFKDCKFNYKIKDSVIVYHLPSDLTVDLDPRNNSNLVIGNPYCSICGNSLYHYAYKDGTGKGYYCKKCEKTMVEDTTHEECTQFAKTELINEIDRRLKT